MIRRRSRAARFSSGVVILAATVGTAAWADDATVSAPEPAAAPQRSEPTASPSLDAPRNVVALELFPLIGGIATVEYQRAFADRFSFYVAPLWAYGSLGGTATGGGLQFGFRYSPFADAPGGVFLSAGVGALVLSERTGLSSEEPGLWINTHVQALLGYTFLLWRHLAVSLGAGGAFTAYENRTGDPNSYGLSDSGLRPVIRIAVGGAF